MITSATLWRKSVFTLFSLIFAWGDFDAIERLLTVHIPQTWVSDCWQAVRDTDVILSLFQRLMKKSRMVPNWSVWHVYDQSRQSYFDFAQFILLQQAKIVYDTQSECCEPYSFCHVHFYSRHNSSFLCVLSLYLINDWITMIMGHS